MHTHHFVWFKYYLNNKKYKIKCINIFECGPNTLFVFARVVTMRSKHRKRLRIYKKKNNSEQQTDKNSIFNVQIKTKKPEKYFCIPHLIIMWHVWTIISPLYAGARVFCFCFLFFYCGIVTDIELSKKRQQIISPAFYVFQLNLNLNTLSTVYAEIVEKKECHRMNYIFRRKNTKIRIHTSNQKILFNLETLKKSVLCLQQKAIYLWKKNEK